jgi:hypothetical protein
MKSLLIFILISFSAFAQDSTLFLKVHFLYGSRPRKEFRGDEPKWFGGILGGHAGVGKERDSILSIVPKGAFHTFSHSGNRHSEFVMQSEREFYGILGSPADSVKKAVVWIPVTAAQKAVFDSLIAAYQSCTPYDYAFFGMRCGASTYDVLSRTGVLPHYSFFKTWSKIFYPRRVRKRVLKLAEANGWTIDRQPGTKRRIWEGDR